MQSQQFARINAGSAGPRTLQTRDFLYKVKVGTGIRPTGASAHRRASIKRAGSFNPLLIGHSVLRSNARSVMCSAAQSLSADVQPSDSSSGGKKFLGLSTDNLAGDLCGGLTTAVIALPLSLAFGVASGAGPLAGLYGAIFSGFFAALFGGTPAQVTGPTGPMTVVTAAMIAQYSATPAVAFSVVFLAGVMQIIMGILKLGRFIRLVPSAVTSGFMSGIGCIILSTQLLPLCGLKSVPNALAAVKAIPHVVANVNPQAALIGSLALALCTLTPKRITKFIPGPLLALVCTTTITLAANLNIPLLGHIPNDLPIPMSLSFPTALMPMMLKSALVLAVLGAIDSLLTSLVADTLTDTFHDSDQEMIGQGLGNSVTGLFGGIPGAGATMRTVVNIRSGGRTPISGSFHSVVLLGVLLGLGGVAKNVPLAGLAGILMKTGLDVIDFRFLQRLPQLPFSTGLIMMSVLLMTVFVDLIVAVGVGCMLASLLLVKNLADNQLEQCKIITASDVQKENEAASLLSKAEQSMVLAGEGAVGVFKMNGSFTFSAANGMLRKLLPVMGGFKAAVLDLGNVTMVDGEAILAIEEMVQKAVVNDKVLVVSGASPEVEQLFSKTGLAECLPAAPSTPTPEALSVALEHLGIPQDTPLLSELSNIGPTENLLSKSGVVEGQSVEGQSVEGQGVEESLPVDV